MNLPQDVCTMMGRIRQGRRSRNMVLYLVACALAMVLVLMTEEE